MLKAEQLAWQSSLTPRTPAMAHTPQEAISAKKSVESTHLYGRHLVGEWAEDGEDVDALRAKASRDVRGTADGGRPMKRPKAADMDDFADMDG